MKKRFFANHARSSAAVISLAIHALFLVAALSFVAISVIQKQESAFEAKPVNRPRMQLKKLQVPVNIKRKTPKPRLRRQIVTKPRMSQTMPDIKMPEVRGVMGGLGGGDGGLGSAGGIGFSMPEIELFGVKSRGEKIFIILDSSQEMMFDEIGGIPAYTIIKEELVRILEKIPPTALVNVAVYDLYDAYTLFPDMVSASPANVARIEAWLKPLNSVRPGMGSKEYGPSTLGKGGRKIEGDFSVEKLKAQRHWYKSSMLAMQQQADAVFLLTSQWGAHWHDMGERDREWYNTPAGQRYREAEKKAEEKLAEENKRRAAEGQPPRVLEGRQLTHVYFPNVPGPPTPPKYYYTPKDLAESMLEIRERYASDDLPEKSGVRRSKSRDRFSFNVVHSLKVREDGGEGRVKLNELVKLFNGEYQSVEGLEAIQSYVQRPAD